MTNPFVCSHFFQVAQSLVFRVRFKRKADRKCIMSLQYMTQTMGAAATYFFGHPVNSSWVYKCKFPQSVDFWVTFGQTVALVPLSSVPQCFALVWHLNSKAAFWWRWMAELPQSINKALYVCLTEGHAQYTILSLSHTVTVRSLTRCEQNTVACREWDKTVFVKTYTSA